MKNLQPRRGCVFQPGVPPSPPPSLKLWRSRRLREDKWRNAVKPTPGQPHQKFHLPQRGCVRAGAEGGAPSETRLGLIPGRTQPRWGWDIRGAGVPRVASALLRQPWAKIRIPVGDEEPPTPTGLCISARGWRNAVKPTPGQPHQKFHQPQRGCVFQPGVGATQ